MAVESHRLAVLGEAVTRMEGLSRLLRNKCTHLSLVESLEQWLGEVRVVLQGAAGGPARAGGQGQAVGAQGRRDSQVRQAPRNSMGEIAHPI